MESTPNAIFVVVFCTVLLTESALAETADFTVINNSNCTCEGYNQIYECRITGSGAIVWRGTAFDCPESSNEIVLLQGSFGTQAVCNNGAISGRIIRVENNTYISQLSVSVSAEMIGSNISCYHDSRGSQNVNLIGSSSLTLTTDPYPPPNNVHLMEANSSHLIFQWSSAAPSCEAILYHIEASGCGQCPNVTNDTTATCVDFPLNDQVCLLAVRTVVCDNVTGSENRSIQVPLRAPNSPEVDVIPTYSYKNKTLLRLTMRFIEAETFNISNGIDGSAFSYTINYTNPNSGVTCTTQKISVAESCVNGSCVFDFPLVCFSSTDINVAVSGTNILGNGSPSNPVTIPGRSDHFVDVSVDLPSNTLTCIFHQQTENGEKYCNIEYGLFRENFRPQNQRNFANRSTFDSVVVLFPLLNDSEQFQPQEEYCFTITASNGTFTVLIEGSTIILDTVTGAGSNLESVAAIIVAFIAAIITITLLGLLITIIILVFVIVKKRGKLNTLHSGEAQFTNQARAHRPTNNDSQVDPQGIETSEEGIGIYSLLQSVGDEPTESQTTHPEPVYVDIGPSTASQENTHNVMCLLPLCDDKVEYAEIKQTEKRGFNADSKQALCDKPLDLDNLLILLRDDVTPRWYEFGVVVGVPKEILEKCQKDYPPDQCVVEVLDYWLMHHCGQLTWRDVVQALREIQLHRLAKYIQQNADHDS